MAQLYRKPAAKGSTSSYGQKKVYYPSNLVTGGPVVKAPTTPSTPPGGPQPYTQAPRRQALSAALNYSGGGGISSQPTALPAYSPQAYNVQLPTIDWSFNPTAAQRGGWQTQATATAGQEIDPQLQAIKAALDQYMAQGQNVRNELNPRYTNQSLAIANIIKNTVKQEAIDNAIRRGATESGWLPSALMEAGQLETEQRGGIEAQRNQDLAALAALEAQQTQAAGEQGTMLEGLRGQRITSALAELENQAWARSQQEKESQWTSALGGEQLRASAYGANALNQLAGYQTRANVAMSNADRALQAAIAAAEQGNVQWNQQYTQSQDAYQRQLQAAQSAQAGVAKEADRNGMVQTQYGWIPITTAYQLGLIPQGQYADTGTGGSSLDEIIAQMLAGQ